VLQAKIWYESVYPAINTGNIRIESTGATKTPLNALIKPNWDKAVSYTRFNKNVVELPLDTAVKLGFTLNKNNSFNFKKNPSKSSFLILNDGKTYTAYIMTILADSAYLQNNYNKLNLNSYSKRDANFSGYVFYSAPGGKLLSGWHYLNGKINKSITPTTSHSSVLQVQSVKNSNIQLNDNGCSISSYLVYTGTSCISAGGAAPTCTDYYDEYDFLICDTIQSVAPPDDGSGGGGSGGFPAPPPPLPVAVNIPKQLDTLITNKTALTQPQIDTLNSKLNQILQDCIGKAIYNYLTANQISFPFTFNPSTNPNSPDGASFDPSSGTINIKNLATLSSTSLEEEFFHAVQNSFYGGTYQYANTASANIEFEAKLLRDMYQVINGIGVNWAIMNDPSYFAFLQNLTNNYTSYPTSFTPTQLGWYKIYLGEFIQSQYNPYYTNDVIDYTFLPTAIFNITSSSTCAHQ